MYTEFAAPPEASKQTLDMDTGRLHVKKLYPAELYLIWVGPNMAVITGGKKIHLLQQLTGKLIYQWIYLFTVTAVIRDITIDSYCCVNKYNF
jgi:hypothetical protein